MRIGGFGLIPSEYLLQGNIRNPLREYVPPEAADRFLAGTATRGTSRPQVAPYDRIAAGTRISIEVQDFGRNPLRSAAGDSQALGEGHSESLQLDRFEKRACDFVIVVHWATAQYANDGLDDLALRVQQLNQQQVTGLNRCRVPQGDAGG